MEKSDTIIETVKDGVKTVRFNKPQRKNAIDNDMYVRITEILNDAATDKNISIVVLTGTGDFYSSGHDLKATKDLDENKFHEVLKDFINAFILFPKLLIAIVNGPAVGVATTVLPLCDLVFASNTAFFYTPFSKLGIAAEGCSSVTFPKLIGYRKAMELLALNYKMPAQEALECGLINYMHKPEELEEKAWNVINEIFQVSMDSILTTKKLLRRPFLDELLETNKMEIAELKKMRSKSKL